MCLSNNTYIYNLLVIESSETVLSSRLSFLSIFQNVLPDIIKNVLHDSLFENKIWQIPEIERKKKNSPPPPQHQNTGTPGQIIPQNTLGTGWVLRGSGKIRRRENPYPDTRWRKKLRSLLLRQNYPQTLERN